MKQAVITNIETGRVEERIPITVGGSNVDRFVADLLANLDSERFRVEIEDDEEE